MSCKCASSSAKQLVLYIIVSIFASDCPHREKIQYGGDIIADSPAALHFYDMSAFYRKVIWDWGDQVSIFQPFHLLSPELN